jgi:parallel beta-helix repeat protein
MILTRFSLVICILLFMASQVLAETFEVFPEKSHGLSFESALEQASAGDTIILAPGIYYPADRLSPKNNGLENKAITIKAELSGQSIIRAGNNKYGLLLKKKSYIVIDGLVFQGFKGCGVKLMECHHLTMRRLKVSGSQSQNISVIDSFSVIVEHCEVFASESTGLYVFAKNVPLESVRDNVIKGNICHDNARSGLLVYGFGNLVEQNICYNNGTQTPYDHGIYCIGRANKVIGNKCTDNLHGSGIRLGGRDHLIKRNVCLRNGRSGAVVAGTNDTAHIAILDNLFAENRHCGVEINASRFSPFNISLSGNLIRRNKTNFWIKPNVSDVRVVKNIFSGAGKHQVRLETAPKEVRFEGNLFFGPNCKFYLGNKTLPSQEFLALIQAGTTCADRPYQSDHTHADHSKGSGSNSTLPWPAEARPQRQLDQR